MTRADIDSRRSVKAVRTGPPGLALRLLAATSFLTRAPLGRSRVFSADEVGRGSLMFPLVGAGIGALQLLPTLGAGAFALQLPHLVEALLGILLLVFATGALHLDALADMSDGFGGGRTGDDTLRIMREPTIGAYGGTALALALMTRLLLLHALLGLGAHSLVVAASALSRWTAVLLGWRLPYAGPRGSGLGSAITDHVGLPEVMGATALVFAITTLCAGARAAFLVAAVCVTAGLSARLCLRRIGGVTGDTLGATIEVSELVALFVAVSLWSGDA